MKDFEFKNLDHKTGSFQIGSCGKAVSSGYKPDITVIDINRSLKLILECEQKTDRKAFLGDFIKAEKYAEECKSSPMLIIVMQPKTNTTVKQIAAHLETYAVWLNKCFLGGLHLSGIFVISDIEYLDSIKANEMLDSNAFFKRGIMIKLGI